MRGQPAGPTRSQFFAIAAAMLLCAAPVPAAEPLIYRRVLVPAEALDSQIRGLLPMKRDEFDRRMTIVGRDSISGADAVARVEEATFQARLENGQLTGSAHVRVTHSKAEPTLLAFAPCSLALESAVWVQAEPRAAIFGRDEAGRLLFLVDEDGELALKWRQAASTDIGGHLVFDLELPAGPRRRMEVSAPAELELHTDSGLIVPSETGSDEPVRRNWVIQLAGRSSLRLEVFPREHKFRTLAASVVRDSTLYQVLPTTVDFEATINLDVLQGSLHNITLASKEPAEVLNVHVDGQVAKYFAEPDESGGRKRYVVDLPAPLSGVNHSLTVTGTAALGASGSWRLPRVLPSGVSVEQGTAEVMAPSWLQLHPKPGDDCVQTAANSALTGRNLDRFAFQLISPSAAVEVAPNRSTSTMVEDSGTHLRFETNQVTGVFIAELSSRAQSAFAIEAQISKQWIVDAVETQPADALADRMTTKGTGDAQRLRLQLATPISGAHPLRVIIRAHARRPAINELLDESLLRFARFPEARGGRQWLTVDVLDRHLRFEQRGRSPQSLVSADELTVHDQSLFEERASQIYEFRPGMLGMLVAAQAQYQADVLTRADVEKHNLLQRVSIRCRPEGSSVSSVLVSISPASVGDVTWRMAGQTLGELPATLENPPATMSAAATHFRILLTKTQSEPFELLGEWTTPLLSETTVPLVTLPEAVHQQGLLEVHSPDNRVSIKTSELKPLPIAGSKSNVLSSLRGRYQYGAGRAAKATLHTAASSKMRPNAWVEMQKLVSQFSIDGRGEHEMSLIVHPAGDDVLHVQAPAHAMHCRLVDENGDEVLLEASGGEFRFRAPLDPTALRTTLRIRYLSETDSGGLWPITGLQAPVLRPDAIVLDKLWQVFIPPQYAPTSTADVSSGRNAEPLSTLAGIAASPDSNWRLLLTWVCGPALVDRLALSSDDERSNEPGSIGWSVVKRKLPSSSEAALWVYKTNVIRGWFWCLMLAGAGLAWSLREAGKLIVVIAASFVAVAITSSQPWSSLAEGMAIGLAIGGIKLLLNRCNLDRNQLVSESGTAGFRVPASHGVAGIVLICVATIVASRAAAQQTADRRPRVIIPVDADQKPIGDYVYLEEPLYAALHRTLEAGGAGEPQWLLQSAHYEVPSAPEVRGDKSAVEEVRFAFDFYTLHESAVVRLPLHRDQVFLLEGRARLDGQSVKLTWRPDGGELSLIVADAGKHRLDLAVGANARSAEDGLHLNLEIPPAARATAQLPVGAKVLPATGNNLVSGQEQTASVPNGQQLKIWWPHANPQPITGGGFEAAQLSLWRVRWAAVVLETLIHVKPNGKALREILVEYDPRLRVLPLTGPNPIGRLTLQEGAPRTVKIELNEPITSDKSLRLTWLWPDASGLGQWDLPVVRVQADRLLRDWTGAWLEPGLSLEHLRKSDAPSAAEFGAEFGESDVRHIAATWDVLRGGPQFVECRPEQTLPRSEQTMELSLSQSVASIRYAARLTNVPRHRFEHRLAVPGNVEVKQAAINQRGRAAPLAWERSADGQLTLCLLESPEPEQTVELLAEIPLQPKQASFSPPRFDILEANVMATTLKVFRQPDVQVSVRESNDWKPIDESLGRWEASRGRLIAAIRGNSKSAAPPSLFLAPNRPHVSGQLLVQVREEDNEWLWEADLDLDIANGLLDELIMSVPNELPSHFEVFPAMDHDFELSRGQQRRIILRPQAAASGSLQVHLRGALPGGGEGISAPNIALEDFAEIRRFVVLDRGTGENEFDWETRGLSAMDEPARQALPARWQVHTGDWFLAAGDDYRAIAHVRHTADGVIQIPLVDVQGALRDQRLEIWADVTVFPATGSELRFSLPRDCRLLQTIVDGITVPSIQCGLRSWNLPSVSDLLPYQLTVVYDKFIPYGQNIELDFAAPEFSAARIGHTLLSISGGGEMIDWQHSNLPPRGTTGEESLFNCAPGEATLLRIQTAAHAMEKIVTAQDGTIPAATIGEVFIRLENRFQTAYEALQRAAETDEVNQSLLERAATSLETVRRIRQRLEQSGETLADIAREESMLDEPSVGDLHVIRYSGAESLPEISVRLHRGPPFTRFASYVLALLIIACAAAFVITPSAWICRNAFLRSAPAQLAAIAVVWWLVAPAGWLGLLLLIAAATGMLRRSEHSATIGERGSSLFKAASNR